MCKKDEKWKWKICFYYNQIEKVEILSFIKLCKSEKKTLSMRKMISRKTQNE